MGQSHVVLGDLWARDSASQTTYTDDPGGPPDHRQEGYGNWFSPLDQENPGQRHGIVEHGGHERRALLMRAFQFDGPSRFGANIPTTSQLQTEGGLRTPSHRFTSNYRAAGRRLPPVQGSDRVLRCLAKEDEDGTFWWPVDICGSFRFIHSSAVN